MPSKRVLVTGAGGFVGANLARLLLREGHEVTLLTHTDTPPPWRLATLQDDVRDVVPRKGRVWPCDITREWEVAHVFATVRPEWVFHLATHGAYPHQRDEKTIIDVNTAGFRNVVHASLKARVSAFVNAGTSSEYGPKDHAPTEDEDCEPQGWYAKSKLWATGYLRRFHEIGGLRSRTLRLYSVYGPWEEPSRLIAQVVARGLSCDHVPYAASETSRDFVYVEDVARAFLSAAETMGDETHMGAIYNIGTGHQHSLFDVAEYARNMFHVRDEPARFDAYPARPHDTATWVANPTKARRFWMPTTPLSLGLGRTALWLREHPELWAHYGVDLPRT